MNNPTLNNEALEVCRALVSAYAQGKRNGGHVDWNDIDLAHTLAKRVIRQLPKETPKGTPK